MIYNPFQSSVLRHTSSSVWLILATIAALVVANSPALAWYSDLLATEMSFSFGDFNLFSHNGHPLTFATFVGDFLMALFFLSVGLEIKREVIIGELSTMKRALLPIIGACGGMIVPVLVFWLCCPANANELRGMAIPMATDIAFSLGVLSMFGRRVPASLKVFLAALAVADDLGGIIVIAIFYTSEIHFGFLFGALFCVMAMYLAGRLLYVRAKSFYLLLGLVVWFCLLNSGVHSTIAGVLTAFCMPCVLTRSTKYFVNEIRENVSKLPVYENVDSRDTTPYVFDEHTAEIMRSIEVSSDRLITPLQDLEDDMRFLVNYCIVPLFAFVSAGICVEGMAVTDLFSGVGFAVLMGLVLGKVLGIFSFSYLAIRFNIVDRPNGASWTAFASVCMLGGIGFTVSMFIADLSYHPLGAEGIAFLNDAKLGILCGSLLSGVLAYILLSVFLPRIKNTSAE